MKKYFLIILILVPLFSTAQKQGNHWYFGNNSIDFSSGLPVVSPIGIPYNDWLHGTATISDSSGNLLFYGNAQQLWNKNNQFMPHGSGLIGGYSTCQIMIIPIPESDTLFYFFTTPDFETGLTQGLRYSVVNMCLDNGLGDVDTTKKNILLLDSVTEKLAATFHANENDIWLVTHKYWSDAFYAYLITSAGISAPVITHVGANHPVNSSNPSLQPAAGWMKISPDGSKLALVSGMNSPALIQLFDFNNATGVVSNPLTLPAFGTVPNKDNGVSFSPDNSKLYVSCNFWGEIFQWDLSSGNPATILASGNQICLEYGIGYYGMQLGPDGKIYVGNCCIDTAFSVITQPNNYGASCGFVRVGLKLINDPRTSISDGFIDSYKYKNGLVKCAAVGIKEAEKKEEISFYPNPATDQITISLQNPSKTAHLSVYNILGKEIISKSFTGNKFNVDVSGLAKGLYLLRVEEDEVDKLRPAMKKVFTKRFIKE